MPDVEETGRTFEENARLKAETIAEILQKPVLADDSGLIVDALGECRESILLVLLVSQLTMLQIMRNYYMS